MAAAANNHEKTESIKRLACYGFLLFACAIAFIVIGGIGVNVIYKVPEWDKSTMYQLHTTCFSVGIPVLITSIVLYFVYRAASDNRQDVVNKGVKWIGLMLFITFVLIIFGVFALGNFITESEVFGNCSSNDNSSRYHFEDVGRLKDVTGLCILVMILTFLAILGICGDRKTESDLLFSKNGHKKTEAIKKLWINAFFIGCYGLVFILIFGLSIGYLSAEPDWSSSNWQQLYYGTIAAALTTIALSISLFRVHKAAQNNRQVDVKERIKLVQVLLWICLIGLILCSVFLGSFVTESEVLGKCRQEESAKDGILIESEKDRNTLRGLSQACIAFLVVSFILIIGQCGERDISKEQLVSVKVDLQRKPSGSKLTDNKNGKKTDQRKQEDKPSTSTPSNDANKSNKATRVQKQTDKKEGNNVPQVVSIGIGSQHEKPKDDHIEMLRKQNEYLQEQNALLRHQVVQQPLAPIELMSQMYGHDTRSDTTGAPRPVLVSSEPLPPIPNYLFLTDIPPTAPPSYNEAVAEQTPTGQQTTAGQQKK